MKKQLMALFVGVCAYVLLAPTALATSNAARARDIVTELRQGDVSPEWSADLLKNSTSIETLYTLAQHFDAQEVAQTTDILSRYFLVRHKATKTSNGFIS